MNSFLSTLQYPVFSCGFSFVFVCAAWEVPFSAPPSPTEKSTHLLPTFDFFFPSLAIETLGPADPGSEFLPPPILIRPSALAPIYSPEGLVKGFSPCKGAEDHASCQPFLASVVVHTLSFLLVFLSSFRGSGHFVFLGLCLLFGLSIIILLGSCGFPLVVAM